jgi:hypothetical protein
MLAAQSGAAPVQDVIPRIDPELAPPLIYGTAALAALAFAQHGLDDLLRFIARPVSSEPAAAALLLDSSLAHQLRFRARQAQKLQTEALDRSVLFRVAPGMLRHGLRPLRVLAVMAPGDFIVNTPLDFITTHLDVRLDLLFARPGEPLPVAMPEHDVAFFAVSEADLPTLHRLAPLFAAWPRPVLNDPARAACLAALPGVAAPRIIAVSRADLAAGCLGGLEYPVLVRPYGSHAGQNLDRIDQPDALAGYLQAVTAERYFVAGFVDYRSADGLFRKYRVAFIDGAPMLCHMAASEHWMVHYLNAGMTDSAGKRAMEAEAMAEFDTGFARRHAAAFAALDGWMGLDYHQIDCAELPDGRLLVFEADVAAIIHMIDPPDLFPYKPPQMRRVMDAFGAMLRRRVGVPVRADKLTLA